MRLPRTAIIATGFILLSFVFGLIVAMQFASHTKPPQPISLSSTMSKTQTEPTTFATTPAPTAASTPNIPRTQLSGTDTAHTSTPATPVMPATPATPPAQQSNPTPITATFAELSDWSTPILYTGTTPKEPSGTMVEYKYCTYYYSNGLTKQQLYQTQYGSSGAFDSDPNTGGWSVTVDPEIGCTIANAPPLQ